MSGTWTIYRREVAGLFFSPLAWILLLVALFLNGVFFTFVYLAGAAGDVTLAFDLTLGGSWVFWLFLVLLPPVLAMRMLAEESRTGSLEFLLTAPVTDVAVVLGKFLAATTFLALLWSSVLVYGLAIARAGVDPDWGGVLGGFLGAVLASALFVSICLFASSLTDTPLLAVFFGFVATLGWLMVPVLAGRMMVEARTLLAGLIGDVQGAEEWIRRGVYTMDVVSHAQQSFLRGILDTSELVFFATWTAFFLFLTTRSLEARRWR